MCGFDGILSPKRSFGLASIPGPATSAAATTHSGVTLCGGARFELGRLQAVQTCARRWCPRYSASWTYEMPLEEGAVLSLIGIFGQPNREGGGSQPPIRNDVVSWFLAGADPCGPRQPHGDQARWRHRRKGCGCTQTTASLQFNRHALRRPRRLTCPMIKC